MYRLILLFLLSISAHASIDPNNDLKAITEVESEIESSLLGMLNNTPQQHAKKSKAALIAETFFQTYQVSQSKISPNGHSIVFIEESKNVSNLILLDSNTFKRYVLLKDKFDDAIDIISYHWIDNKTVIVSSYVKGKGRILLAINLTFDATGLTAIRNEYLIDNVFMVNELPKIEDKFVVGRSKEGKTSLYTLDISKKNIASQLRSYYKLNKYGPPADNWLTDANANIRLGYGFDESDNKNKVWYKKGNRNSFKLIWEGAESVEFLPVLVSEDNSSLFVISNAEGNYKALYKYDIEARQFVQKVFEVQDTDLTSVIYNTNKDEILGVSYVQNGFVQHSYFNSLEKTFELNLTQSFNESNPYIVDYNLDKDMLIIQTSDSTDPGVYHLYDVKKNELIKYATKAPWFKQFNLANTQVINSISADGQKIESYLTMPNVKSGAQAPLIVLPHGGPISVRDTRHFSSHTQYLATLGYAVLQPNYRGSAGYGKKFKNKGMGQWGRLIEDDIVSAINKVISEGLINKDKICIYGISYGGYSALINAINRPDLFKCAASYAGVTDLPLLFNDVKFLESNRFKTLMEKIVGNPQTELNTLIEFSPVYQSHKLDIPVFLAQGDNDSVVDIEHYFRMKKVLNVHNKEYRTLLLEGEGHGFKYLNSIVTFYEQLDRFFRSSLALEQLE